MSKWGEGTGTPMQNCSDPNNPSHDPATCNNDTVQKILWLCENAWEQMTAWEKAFCTDVYGKSPFTRKQNIQVWKIHKKYRPK